MLAISSIFIDSVSSWDADPAWPGHNRDTTPFSETYARHVHVYFQMAIVDRDFDVGHSPLFV